MPSWWGRSSSKEKKKENKESFIDAIHRKFKIGYEEKCSRSVGPRRRGIDTISERGSRSRAQSRSPSPSTLVSRCQSFAERPLAQPLPLPRLHLKDIQPSDSENNVAAKHVLAGSSQPSPVLPLPRPDSVQNRLDSRDIEGDVATGSISSDTSSDCCDPSDSRLLSPQVSDHENHNRTAFSRHTSMMQKDISPNMKKRNLKETAKPIDKLFHNQILPTSPKKASLRARVPNIQIPHHGAFCSAPDSSMSSPSRSPMRIYGHDQVISPVSWAGKTYQDVVAIGSGHCSSPGSGYNSGHNSVGGDMSGPLFWPQSRCSPECSPIPSPRMASPGPNSRIQSGAVTPLHPRAGATESPSSRPEDGKQQSHRLPLPPIKVPNNCPFLPAYSTSTTPSVPRSPGRSENSLSPGSHWKKGRLLGRGTFGHVYLGFNSESGEMCAMKEVTLFSDDPKSKESVQQLGQEIALLSRLRHPNIVQYYGSETVDDKLYIYLEYVSGGSIYKLLQEYGQFGEIAMRNYTQQILSGLAYLHAKNTVHRDIKGANILVDPNGRVKLADFGMAKHITGQSCPLSFKGSPYWMAPEVIKNSNGRNLAVDIWSLGCTVLEMATTKPPWSQYEGVAAMFKIGNSKELPVIPDTLSDEGKDFVRKCLQRNPLNRPTAAQLLEHPFVNNVAQLERCILNLEHLEPTPPVMNSATSLGAGYAKNVRYLDSGGVVNQFRGERTGSGSSASHMPKNMSCPVSPIGSPLLHSRSPRHTTRAMSPSPISSPRAISGSSTPLTGGSGAIPFQQSRTACLYKATGASSVSPNRRYPHANNTYYQDTKADRFGSMPQVPKIFRENSSSENGNNKFEPSPRGHPRDLDHGQLFFADRVSQKLLRDHVKMNLSLNLNHGSQMLGHANGV